MLAPKFLRSNYKRDVAPTGDLLSHPDSNSAKSQFADLGRRKALLGWIEYQSGALDGDSAGPRLGSSQPPGQFWQALFD
jgi:hypothetical protein